MTQTVVGVFDTPDAARAAEEELVNRGIDRSAVHLAATESAAAASGETRQRHGTMGGIRNFFSELFGTGHSDEVGHYSEAIRRGGVMLAVDLPDGADIEPVRDVLADAGAIDIDRRVEQWREQGWTGYNPEAQPYTPDEIAQERSTVVPVVQEEIEIGKREVAKGRVRIYSRTVETPVQETLNLREEHATIERRPVDRPATPAEIEAATGDNSIEIREMAERPMVSKTARVVEEVVVGKEATQSSETVQETVRRTEVEVERGEAAEGSTGTSAYLRPYEDFEPDYRRDFQTRFGAQGGSYDDYAPAYRYGHTLAGDPRYEGRPWADIEPEARRDWERQYPGSTWERFKLAVEHGWERVTGSR